MDSAEAPTTGTIFTAVSNTSANPLTGTFTNLPDAEPSPSAVTPSKLTTKAAMGMI